MNENYNQLPQSQDGKSIGFGILGFFFPLVGLILFLVWRTEKPLKAKSVGIGALVSVAVQVVFTVIYVAVFGSFALFGVAA